MPDLAACSKPNTDPWTEVVRAVYSVCKTSHGFRFDILSELRYLHLSAPAGTDMEAVRRAVEAVDGIESVIVGGDLEKIAAASRKQEAVNMLRNLSAEDRAEVLAQFSAPEAFS